MKERFKKEKLKATLKHLTREIKLQEGEMANVPSSKLINEEYFIFGDKELFFRRSSETCETAALTSACVEPNTAAIIAASITP